MTQERVLNCAGCDYFAACHKAFVQPDGTRLLAKESGRNMSCINIVQPICKDCELFHARRCAAWKVLNGKLSRQNLTKCTKKILRSVQP